MKTISLPTDHLIDQDRESISELIYSYLKDIGCKTESFSWSIEVDYIEGENSHD